MGIVMAATALPAAPPCGGHGDRGGMVVTAAWLADHLKDRNLVILAVGSKQDYDTAHIPGALFLPYDSIYAKGHDGLSVELPPMGDLASAFGKLGVSNDSRIVLYFNGNGFSQNTRVYLTLDAMGLGPHTSILDGGFPVWQSEGRAVTTEVRHVTEGKIEPCAQSDVITDLAFVRSNLNHPGVDIVDARLAEFYSGVRIPQGKRAGHIPGASNIAFNSLVDEQGKLKPRAALEEQFRAAGIKSGDRVVSYCHIGQQATMVYFVARYLGYDARMFDGSWEEWSAHAELPVETSPTATHAKP